MTVPRRPQKFTVGDAKVRPVRGPKGSRWYWRAVVYRDGREQTLWTGWATRAEAVQEVAAVVAAGGKRPAPETAGCETLRDLLELFVGHAHTRAEGGLIRESTAQSYQAVGIRVVEELGEARLVRLNLAAIERYVAARVRAGAAPSSIALELRVVRAAWRWGRTAGLAPDRSLETPKVNASEHRNNDYTPTRDEIIRVVSALDGWHRAAVLLLWATGARKSEIADLTWDEVHLDREVPVLILPAYRTKARRPRVVPLGPDAVVALQELGPAEEGRVFAVTSKTVKTTLATYIARACKLVRVPVFTPHGLRRAAADEMARAGVDIGAACAITGHSPKVMLEHYRRATTADVVEAVRRAGMGAMPAGKVVAGPWGDGR